MGRDCGTLAILGGEPLLTSPIDDAWIEIDDSIVRAVTAYLTHHRSTRYDETLTMDLEAKLASVFGVADCLVGQGATECLRFLIRALIQGQMIEAAVIPAHIFPGLAAVLAGSGLRLAPAAVDPETLLARPSALFGGLRAAGATPTLALLHCPWGQPWTDGVDRKPVGSSVVIPGGTPLIIDLSHAVGSLVNGSQVSLCGADAGILSMGAGKFLSGHELGAILLRNHRLRDDVLEMGGVRRLPGAYSCGENRDVEPTFGKLRGHPLAMVVARAQLDRLPAKLSAHYASSQLLREELSALDGYHLVGGLDPEPRQHFRHILRLDPEAWRGLSLETVVQALRAEGVPVSRIEYLSPVGHTAPPIADTYLSLPGYVCLRDSAVGGIVRGLEKVWSRRRCLTMK